MPTITTKTGDKGQTSLASGERLPKYHLRIEAIGTLDELISHLGEAKLYVRDQKIKKQILSIQKDLFTICSLLTSTKKSGTESLKKSLTKIEEQISQNEKKIKQKGFVIPGANIPSAKLDICRAIARRAERVVVKLTGKEEIDSVIMQYLNRLSDLLFVWARCVGVKQNINK